MNKEKILAAIAALEAADVAQQEVLEGDRCYELHCQLEDAITDLEELLQECMADMPN